MLRNVQDCCTAPVLHKKNKKTKNKPKNNHTSLVLLRVPGTMELWLCHCCRLGDQALGFLKHTFLVGIDVVACQETAKTGVKKDDEEHRAINQLRSGNQGRSGGRRQIDNCNQRLSGTRRTAGVIKTVSGVEEAAYIHKEEAGTIGHR